MNQSNEQALERLRQLYAAYGADPARWPRHERFFWRDAVLLDLVESESDARMVDRLLALLPTPVAPAQNPRQLAQVNPGDSVELTPEGNRLIAISNGVRIGVVEPRVAARLLKLIADGNKYAAGVTSLGDKDVRIILREVFQDPRNYGKVSFPTAAKSTDLRPYTKGTLVREEMELEEDLEDDEEDEEIEDLDRVLPPEATTDEAFEEEQDELDDA